MIATNASRSQSVVGSARTTESSGMIRATAESKSSMWNNVLSSGKPELRQYVRERLRTESRVYPLSEAISEGCLDFSSKTLACQELCAHLSHMGAGPHDKIASVKSNPTSGVALLCVANKNFFTDMESVLKAIVTLARGKTGYSPQAREVASMFIEAFAKKHQMENVWMVKQLFKGDNIHPSLQQRSPHAPLKEVDEDANRLAAAVAAVYARLRSSERSREHAEELMDIVFIDLSRGSQANGRGIREAVMKRIDSMVTEGHLPALEEAQNAFTEIAKIVALRKQDSEPLDRLYKIAELQGLVPYPKDATPNSCIYGMSPDRCRWIFEEMQPMSIKRAIEELESNPRSVLEAARARVEFLDTLAIKEGLLALKCKSAGFSTVRQAFESARAYIPAMGETGTRCHFARCHDGSVIIFMAAKFLVCIRHALLALSFERSERFPSRLLAYPLLLQMLTREPLLRTRRLDQDDQENLLFDISKYCSLKCMVSWIIRKRPPLSPESSSTGSSDSFSKFEIVVQPTDAAFKIYEYFEKIVSLWDQEWMIRFEVTEAVRLHKSFVNSRKKKQGPEGNESHAPKTQRGEGEGEAGKDNEEEEEAEQEEREGGSCGARSSKKRRLHVPMSRTADYRRRVSEERSSAWKNTNVDGGMEEETASERPRVYDLEHRVCIDPKKEGPPLPETLVKKLPNDLEDDGYYDLGYTSWILDSYGEDLMEAQEAFELNIGRGLPEDVRVGRKAENFTGGLLSIILTFLKVKCSKEIRCDKLLYLRRIALVEPNPRCESRRDVREEFRTRFPELYCFVTTCTLGLASEGSQSESSQDLFSQRYVKLELPQVPVCYRGNPRNAKVDGRYFPWRELSPNEAERNILLCVSLYSFLCSDMVSPPVARSILRGIRMSNEDYQVDVSPPCFRNISLNMDARKIEVLEGYARTHVIPITRDPEWKVEDHPLWDGTYGNEKMSEEEFVERFVNYNSYKPIEEPTKTGPRVHAIKDLLKWLEITLFYTKGDQFYVEAPGWISSRRGEEKPTSSDLQENQIHGDLIESCYPLVLAAYERLAEMREEKRRQYLEREEESMLISPPHNEDFERAEASPLSQESCERKSRQGALPRPRRRKREHFEEESSYYSPRVPLEFYAEPGHCARTIVSDLLERGSASPAESQRHAIQTHHTHHDQEGRGEEERINNTPGEWSEESGEDEEKSSWMEGHPYSRQHYFFQMPPHDFVTSLVGLHATYDDLWDSTSSSGIQNNIETLLNSALVIPETSRFVSSVAGCMIPVAVKGKSPPNAFASGLPMPSPESLRTRKSPCDISPSESKGPYESKMVRLKEDEKDNLREIIAKNVSWNATAGRDYGEMISSSILCTSLARIKKQMKRDHAKRSRELASLDKRDNSTVAHWEHNVKKKYGIEPWGSLARNKPT